jgi:sugar phosphate isomerase/epimerase
VQTRIASEAEAKATSAAAERGGLYIEGIVGLPKSDADVARFESELATAKAAGAEIVRTVCLSGRRYEVFDTLEAFMAFADESWHALRRAALVAARQRVKLAVENHKDWRTDEMLAWLKKLDSEWVRVCLDTGNSIALLEEPLAVVEALAPFTVTTHLKDMAVTEYDEGFLLSEVPLGTGFLDIPKVVRVLRTANPGVRLNLEMITRDPLRVPCLTAKYWATMPSVPGGVLAEALARVRRHKSTGPLPTISGLDHGGQLRAEAKNIERCLRFAVERLRS